MTDEQDDKRREEFSEYLQSLYVSPDSNINVNEQTVEDQAILPGPNVPEKILFVIDTAREPDCTLFETRTNAKFSPLYMIKRVVEIFVNVKSGLNPKHEFALMILRGDGTSDICNFTNNRKSLLSMLEKIEEHCLDENTITYDLSVCFENIASAVPLEDDSCAPTFVARVILLYARSHCIPQFLTGEYYFDSLMRCKNFFLDCLYIHEPVSEDNECQAIYTKLSSLDTKQTSYILEAGRNPATLHTNMAKLIAHPLQRARQDDSPYSLCVPGSPQEIQTNI